MPYRAIDIARYIINKCTSDDHPISNLQLQKILYYVQKAFLDEDMALFEDDFEAWQFGPVVPAVYYQYCGFGATPIRMEYNITLDDADRIIIDPIVEKKRILYPWDMVNDTHMEGKAWNEIYQNGQGDHHIIPQDLIRRKG